VRYETAAQTFCLSENLVVAVWHLVAALLLVDFQQLVIQGAAVFSNYPGGHKRGNALRSCVGGIHVV
jgi:hypothetical protein